MKKEIEEQFDKRFTDYPGGVYLKEKPARKEDILDFIEKLIQQERERIIEEIEKMKKEYEPIDDKRGVHDEQAVGYNQALEDIIKNIK